MILYHFTSAKHLELIESAGFLRTTESNISMRIPHKGPKVVWLTSELKADAVEQGLNGSRVDKTEVRITVDVPESEVHKWLTWSRAHGITKAWATALESNRRPETWFVIERPIPRAEWVALDSEPPQ